MPKKKSKKIDLIDDGKNKVSLEITEEDSEEENKFCKYCGKPTKHGNEFCTPEEGRIYFEEGPKKIKEVK